MFDKDFYPTPEPVIYEMLHGVDIQGKIILEPSAGRGDIVTYLKDNGAKEVIACELNSDLRKIVESKCKVINNDFLSLTSSDISHIDLIVMNPPFSADEKHILHAIDIAPAGCQIIALCNYDTYRNGYTQIRLQLRKFIDENGTIKNLKDAFSIADRTTYIDVGLIRIKKPGGANDEFEGFFMDDEQEANGAAGIMSYNVIRDLVNRYVAAVKLFDEQLDLGVRMNALTGSFFSSTIGFSCTQDGKPQLRDDYKKDLQKSAWKWVFAQLNMNKYTTKGLKDEINKFVERQTEVPFTMRNIYKMVEIIIGTHAGRMDKAIEEVFDKLTMHCDENRYYLEGWKSNSHYLITEKFIMPYMTDPSWSGSRLHLHHSGNYEKLDDLLKAICYLTGKNYDECTSLWSLVHSTHLKPGDEGHDDTIPAYQTQYRQYDWGKWYEWEFFEFRGYKKGTMHFKFKDRKVWELLNKNIARIKGYTLPEGMKSKKAA